MGLLDQNATLQDPADQQGDEIISHAKQMFKDKRSFSNKSKNKINGVDFDTNIDFQPKKIPHSE